MTTSVHLKISLIALVVLSLHQTTNAQFLYQDCYDGFGSFDILSNYLTNINEAITQLSSLASTSYYNTATIGTGTDQVNALFYCRYDVTSDVCQSCVTGAIDRVAMCLQSVESIQFYQECTVHYSNRTIAGVFEDLPRYSVHALRTVNDDGEFDQLLATTFTSLITDTVTGFSVASPRYFATTTAKYSGLQTIYALAQCNEDITSSDCSDCLQIGFGNFTEKYPGAFLGQVFMPSCRLSYKLSSEKMTEPYDFDITIISNTPDAVPPLSSPSDALTPSSPTVPDQGLILTPPPPPPPPSATFPQGLFSSPSASTRSTGTTGISATIASMVLLCFVLLL